MKPQHFAAVSGSLLLIVAILLFTGSPTRDQTPTTAVPTVNRTFTVTGEGEYRPKPDFVQITIAVVSTGVSAAEAEASHVALVKKITGAMVSNGADDPGTDLPQVTLSAGPGPTLPGGAATYVFRALSQVRVNVKSVPKHQAVIDSAMGAGATSLDGVVYGIDLPERARGSAVALAVDNARTRAKALAKEAGESLADLRGMEVIEEAVPDPNGPLVFRVKVRAVFGF